MTENHAEFAKLLFDIEDCFLRLEFFFLILMILSISFFFTEGIIPKLIVTSFYGIFFLEFLSFHIMFNANIFFLHTEKLCLHLDVFFVFNRLAYLDSVVKIFEFTLLILAICNGIFLLKEILSV